MVIAIIIISKIDDGIRLIAVDETIHRIASKCALKRVEKLASALLSPHQLGCSVLTGVATHSMHTKIDHASYTDVLLKLA